MNDFTFDAQQFSSLPTADIVPPGAYAATVIDADRRPAKSGDGFYIQVAYRLDSSDHAGRVVFGRYHIESRIIATTTIAAREFALFCSAVGISQLQSLDHLRNRSLSITIAVKQRDRSGELANTVTSYAPAPPTTSNARTAPSKRTA